MVCRELINKGFQLFRHDTFWTKNKKKVLQKLRDYMIKYKVEATLFLTFTLWLKGFGFSKPVCYNMGCSQNTYEKYCKNRKISEQILKHSQYSRKL